MRCDDCAILDRLLLISLAAYGALIFGLAVVACLIDRWRDR